MKKIWNIFTTILAVLGLIALAWFVISYAEICVKFRQSAAILGLEFIQAVNWEVEK